MECEDLSLILKNENESREIATIPITFYKDAKKYLRELEVELGKYGPRSKEYLMLSDELNTGIGRIEEIFYLRRNKIFSMAAQASNLVNIQHKNYNRLLPEEKKMYSSLTQSGETLKRELLDPVLYPEEEPEQEEDKQERVLVRILKDIPTFAGDDGRSYTVKTEDTVLLPVSNAQVLIKKNAALLIGN